MIQIIGPKGVVVLSKQDYRELIDLACDGRDMAEEYDYGNVWAPQPDPQANAERNALIDKCSIHL